IAVAGSNGSVTVNGLPAQVVMTQVEGALDRLVIDGRGGADVIDATGLPAGSIGLEMFGGLGNDVMIGSGGDDLMFGGDGDDQAMMGAGNDTFVWNPGDDN